MNACVQYRIFLIGLCSVIAACQILGPDSIKSGRQNYNEVIQETSKEQTFANIVRVRNHEPTTFIDINQISAGVTFQGIAMGGVTNIGLTKPGSGNLSLQYQENPVISYQPLGGAALISQIATPITIESLGNLYNSDWPIASLLSLAIDRITPGYSDYASAINALIALDNAGAVTLTPTLLVQDSAAAPKKKPLDKTSSASAGETGSKSSYPVLVVTFQPRHPYTGAAIDETETQRRIKALWCRFTALVQGTVMPCVATRQVALRTGASPLPKGTSQVGEAQLRTRSAYGILKAAAEPPASLIAFVKLPEYQTITSYPWNSSNLDKCDGTSFYTLLPEIEPPSDHPVATQNTLITNEVGNLIRSTEKTRNCLYTTSDFLDPDDIRSIKQENRLSGLRRFLLIIMSDNALPNSYVSYFDGTQWYSIAKNDEITQKNFLLISQFLTIQATTAGAPPLTPTISVGAK